MQQSGRRIPGPRWSTAKQGGLTTRPSYLRRASDKIAKMASSTMVSRIARQSPLRNTKSCKALVVWLSEICIPIPMILSLGGEVLHQHDSLVQWIDSVLYTLHLYFAERCRFLNMLTRLFGSDHSALDIKRSSIAAACFGQYRKTHHRHH